MSKYLTRNQLQKEILTASKNHGEYPFHPKKKKTHDNRVLDAESCLRLYFNDADLTSYSEDETIIWRVVAGDLSRPMTMQTALLLNGVRVAGIDPQAAPRSYRYDRSTTGQSKYHMNVARYNEKGVLISMEHIDIERFTEYFTDIYKFAEAVAGIWNIDYWTEESLL